MQSLRRRHPPLHHVGKLPSRIHRPRKPARVRPKRNLHATLQSPPKRVLMDRQHLHPHRSPCRRATLRHISPHKNGRHVEDPPSCHRLQVFLRDVVPILDRIHARFHRVVHSLQSHRVRSDLPPLP